MFEDAFNLFEQQKTGWTAHYNEFKNEINDNYEAVISDTDIEEVWFQAVQAPSWKDLDSGNV